MAGHPSLWKTEVVLCQADKRKRLSKAHRRRLTLPCLAEVSPDQVLGYPPLLREGPGARGHCALGVGGRKVEHPSRPTPGCQQAGRSCIHTQHPARGPPQRAGQGGGRGGGEQMKRGKSTSPNLPIPEAGRGGQGALTFQLPY